MAERIIMLVCCFLCSVPFLIISTFNKDSITPIAFLLSGIGSCIQPIMGIVLLGLECTIGVALVYKSYRYILRKYS